MQRFFLTLFLLLTCCGFAKEIAIPKTEAQTVGLIEVNDKSQQISQGTWIYVKNALDYYKKNPPAFIILELNTPGGEVFAAQKISDALKNFDTQFDIPVVAYINNWAISAGAMLAYSCRYITVVKDASMGAAEPVMVTGEGKMVSASEKVNSALRADFANRAGFFDRNSDIAQAMVDKDMILVFRDGKIVKLDKEEQVAKTDKVITAKGKLLTLSAKQMQNFDVSDLLLKPKKVQEITQEEKAVGKWPAEKMLLFQEKPLSDFSKFTIDRFNMDWKTQFLVLLAHPMVSSMLFLGLMIGFYLEVSTPGFGLPGSVSLLCLALIMISSFALDIANVLEVVLLFVGIAFIALDLFLIPTFGILGIAGVIFFIIGLFGLMLPGLGSVSYEFDTKTFNAAGQVFVERLAWLSGTLLVGVFAISLLAKYIFPKLANFSRLVLVGSEETREAGYVAGPDIKSLPPIGAKGQVLATLRPSGKIIIDDTIYDAITNGDFIERETPIIVVHHDGSVIVVDEEK